jgi:hypothetical protein
MSDSVTDLDRRTIGDVVDVLTGASDRAIRTYSRGEITYSLAARECYSYGSHFPLFRYVPASRGRRALFVLNGDEWRSPRSRTPDHQAAARDLAAATGTETIVLPFSALAGAGLDLDSIRPIHVRDDARWTEQHELPDGAPDLDALETADAMREDDSRSETDWRGQPCASHGTWTRVYTWRRGGHDYTRRLYRQSHEHGAGWLASDSWDRPTTEHTYMDGLELRRDAGAWTYTTHHHRLGDSLFSATRETRETRPAVPFEHERDTARETVTLRDSESRAYCVADDAPDHRHEAGPGAPYDVLEMPRCVFCGLELRADVVMRRRARYLSSFDYNEPAPLYFLAEVPRGSGETVETAIDALAPRAVHAAIARGRDVLRQGDVFYVATDLTREDLAARGATFCRLTCWTRDAKPRAGEPGYRAPATAGELRRERRYARRVWRERFREAVRAATAYEHASGSPYTPRGARLTWRKRRAEHAAGLERARLELRRATLARPELRACHRYYGETLADAVRREHVSRVRRARETLERLEHERAYVLAGRVLVRDDYRNRYGSNAANGWQAARRVARERFRPGDAGTPAGELRRARVRRALAIYGTAHSASETATVRGAVYARGIARHVPDLEPGRRGGRDHRHVTLGDGETWYLAIRNTVPRQSRARRRRRARATA